MLRKMILGVAVVGSMAIWTLVPASAVAQTNGVPWGSGVLVPVGPVAYPTSQNVVPVAPQYTVPAQRYPLYATQLPAVQPAQEYPLYTPPLTTPQTGPTRPSVE